MVYEITVLALVVRWREDNCKEEVEVIVQGVLPGKLKGVAIEFYEAIEMKN